MRRASLFSIALVVAGLICLGQQPRAWWQSVQQISVASATPVAIDVCGSLGLSGTSVSTFTYTGLTIGAGLSNSALTVPLTFSDKTVSSVTVTWDGVSMTQRATVNGSLYRSDVWGLRNPNSGNKNLVVNWTTNTQLWIAGCSWKNVNQTSDALAFPNPNTNSGTNPTTGSVTITSASGHFATAAFANQNGSMTAVSGTQIYRNNTGALNNAGANYDVGAASVVLSATWNANSAWTAAGVDISN